MCTDSSRLKPFAGMLSCRIFFLLAVLGLHSVCGAVVIYDEGVSGDLPHGVEPLKTFVLGPGINTFIGSIGDPGDPADEFAFIVPFDFTTSHVFHEVAAPGLDLYEIDPISGFDLPTVWPGSGGLPGDLLITPPSSGPMLSELLPGEFRFKLVKGEVDDPPWRLDFVVEPARIPEPASFALVVLGVSLLGVNGRFRNAISGVRRR